MGLKHLRVRGVRGAQTTLGTIPHIGLSWRLSAIRDESSDFGRAGIYRATAESLGFWGDLVLKATGDEGSVLGPRVPGLRLRV